MHLFVFLEPRGQKELSLAFAWLLSKMFYWHWERRYFILKTITPFLGIATLNLQPIQAFPIILKLKQNTLYPLCHHSLRYRGWRAIRLTFHDDKCQTDIDNRTSQSVQKSFSNVSREHSLQSSWHCQMLLNLPGLMDYLIKAESINHQIVLDSDSLRRLTLNLCTRLRNGLLAACHHRGMLETVCECTVHEK